MSGYKALRDVSNNFEQELKQLSSQLFSVKVGEKFENAIAKRLSDMTLFSSKLKLLRAKPMSLTPQVKEQPHDNALQEYGDAATWKVLEQMTVKPIIQAHAVKSLITAPDSTLDPELVERKEAIIESLNQYRNKEAQLYHTDTLLKEREAELASLRADWDNELGTLRDIRAQQDSNESGNRGPLFVNLSKVVDKLELMRWLIGRLVCARGNYDWLADPHRRLAVLSLTRAHNTVDTFTQD